jgi:hypothetical protein
MNANQLAERLEQHHTVFNDSAAAMLRKQHTAIRQLREALAWYVSEDDVMEYGDWTEENAYWFKGKRRAEIALAATENLCKS